MRTNDLHLLGEVSRRLGCAPYRIVYLLATGKVPEPRLRIGNRRLFTTEDIARIAARLGVQTRPGVAPRRCDE
jgi:DNA-binding transcriptional MerR regulator